MLDRSSYLIIGLVLFHLLPVPARGSDKLRLAVAGLSHGHVHGLLARTSELPVEIVGIWEPDEALRKQASERYQLPKELFFAELSSMLDATRPQAVAAFNPIAGHVGVVEACAPRGIHVMVEKPLAFTARDAHRIRSLSLAQGIFVLTNYETTWYASTAEIDRRVRERRDIGELRKIVVHDGHQGPKEIGVGPEFLAWLADPVQNGAGALVDFGCYGADLTLWLLDGRLPETVTAVTQQIKPEIYPHVDDEATITLTYPGTQAILQASWNWPFNRKDIEIYGTGGYLFALDGQEMRARLSSQNEAVAYRVSTAPRFPNPFEYLRAVVAGEVIVSPEDLSSLELNVSVARILDAAIRSAREGRTVRLD
jgi:predicted dehydrogenase